MSGRSRIITVAVCVCLAAGSQVARVSVGGAAISASGFCAKVPRGDPRFPAGRVALVVGSETVARGGTVAVRLWNGSGERIGYSVNLLRQRFDGSRWVADSPTGEDQRFAVLRRLTSGAATPCLRSTIAPDATPGRYRFLKLIYLWDGGQLRTMTKVARFMVRGT